MDGPYRTMKISRILTIEGIKTSEFDFQKIPGHYTVKIDLFILNKNKTKLHDDIKIPEVNDNLHRT